MAPALISLLASMGEAAVIGGRILAPGDRPVEHARVESEEWSVRTFSDREGVFELGALELPTTLVVAHPRFDTMTVRVDAPTEELELVLSPKQEVYETIAVSANRGEGNFAPVSVATSVVRPTESPSPASSVTELVAETVGVAENGQGGIFQTYSVRGVSRQRVLTLVDGMRIVGERRAGVSASFLDPLLLSTVEVVRGPSSTYYGSGALGGVVQLFPRRYEGVSAAVGFESQGGEKSLLVARGDKLSGWGLALRDAGRAETPSGALLNSGFSQLSGSLRRSWEHFGLNVELSLLGSSGNDIGKANADWPQRATNYPRERHVIARLGVRRPAKWELIVALHPNRLETEVEEKGSGRSELESRAFDLSLSWQRRLRFRFGSWRLGGDYFGRRGVSTKERDYAIGSLEPQLVDERETLASGAEDELGLFGAWEWNRGRSVLVAGGRLAWQWQKTAESRATNDGAVTLFAGIVAPVGAGLEVVANAGNGLRFPSLSERFFSGTTGRGSVVGNRDLESERSLSLDVGLRFFGERLFLSGYLFTNTVDSFIERVEIASDLLTFQNLPSGRIEGVEIDGILDVSSGWAFTFGGHAIEGRGEDDIPLADIPPRRLFIGARLTKGRWGCRGRYEARSSKDQPGSGEKTIPAANLLSAALDYELRTGLSVLIAVRNALDEEYFSSSDRKAQLAPGRSFSIATRWSR